MANKSQISDIERLVMYMVHDVEPALVSFQSVLGLFKKNRFEKVLLNDEIIDIFISISD